MQLEIVLFVLLHFSILLVVALMFVIIRMKHKRELHYISFGLTLTIFIWCASLIMERYAEVLFDYSGMLFTYIYFTAVGFISLFVFYLGLSFSSGQTIRRGFYILFVFPVINAMAIWTNDFHHMFFVVFSKNSDEIVRGPFWNMQLVYAYTMLAMGLFFLISFSIKNSGFFSKQSLLIVFGASIPLAIDLLFVFNLFSFSLFYEPISFSFAVICFMLAIMRFDFLNIVPIALQTVVDHISDSFIVINGYNEVVDFNKSLKDTFGKYAQIKRKMDIYDWLEQIKVLTHGSSSFFQNSLRESERKHKPISFDKQFSSDEYDKTFTIEIKPIISGGVHKGTIIIFKDITEQRESFELIQKTQSQLIESEHLVSLGQLVGGIAHNLKTPIMSVSGGLEGLTDLVTEYEESIADPLVTREDHLEIAKEMRDWIDKMKNYCAYMSDIISTVKGQAVQLTSMTTDKFILKELLKRIDILMNHELKKYGCRLVIDCRVDKGIEIKGEINSLVQVINNLISNSIEAYDGKEGTIDFDITYQENMVQFAIGDYGVGMTEDIKSRLFKEMITTKAKHGTGLGLYMSYSTIRGKFGGKMWFESELGKGSVFYVAIPSVVGSNKRRETV
jgi:two-component system sensor histidine kinase HupT/HoxJ